MKNKTWVHKRFFTILLVGIMFVSVGIKTIPAAQAFGQSFITPDIVMYFDDGGPITTEIDIRFSLWRQGVPAANEIDGSGNIVTGDVDYGDWQRVVAYTPDNGDLTVNLFDDTDFPDFPEVFGDSAYLQVEYKYPEEANTEYRMMDLVGDSPDTVKRLVIVPTLLSLQSAFIKGGTPDTSFTLDISDNATNLVELIFGGDAKSLVYDVVNGWFNLNDRLNINGFAGTKLTVNADASDSETALVSVRNSGGSSVFSVDEDGDVVTSGTVDGVDISAEMPKVWRGGVGGSSGYQQNVKQFVRTVTATPSSGVITVYVTNDDTNTGTNIFSTVYSINVTAQKNEATATNVPLASVKSYNSTTGQLDINVVEGATLVNGIEFESDSITLNIDIVGV